VFRDVNASITCPEGGYRTRLLDDVGTTGSLCRP
jgi:hypothetical protein